MKQCISLANAYFDLALPLTVLLALTCTKMPC